MGKVKMQYTVKELIEYLEKIDKDLDITIDEVYSIEIEIDLKGERVILYRSDN